MEIEGTVGRWRSLGIEVRTPIARGAGVALNTINPQISKVRELTNEIKDLFVISPWRFQFQGSQGPQKRPEAFFHLWDKRGDIQPTGLEAPEDRKGVKVSGMESQIVCEDWVMGKGDREVAGVLEKAAFAQGW